MTRSRKSSKLVISALLAAVLLSSPFPGTASADGTGAAQSAPALGRVELSGGSYAEVKQVNLLSDQSGKIVTFTLSVTNDGGKDISFIDYWVRVVSKTGAQFTVKMMPQDKDKNTIPAGSTKELSFYASVNEETSLNDLKFRMIKWDFGVDNFERALGEISVPDDFTNVTPAGSAQVVKLSGTYMSLSIGKFTLGKNEKYSLPSVKLKLENVDNHSLTVPAYQFAIRTQEGYMYPMEAKGLKDLVVNPQETKDLTLAGSVPASVTTEGWQLVVTQNLTDLKLNVPIAFFQLPEVTTQDGNAALQEVQFTDENGLYTAKMNGMYRLPWEDQDILTADVTVSNKGSDSLPVPHMIGYFLLDGSVKVEAKVVTPAKVLGLTNGSSVGLQMAAKVPYTYEFSKLKLVLQEKTTDDKTEDVLEFETPAEVLNVPIADAAVSFTHTEPGYRAKFTVQNVDRYEGKSTDLIAARVIVENQEKRFTNVTKLVANLRASDGNVYPASVMDVKDKVAPGGKAQLLVTTVLPKGVSTQGMNLLLGEAVSSDGKVSSSGGSGEGSGASSGSGAGSVNAASAADMYVKPFAFWLPQEKNEVKTPLKDIVLAPYTLSIDHLGTSLENNELSLKFNYEIVKDIGTITSIEGRRIVFQMNDTNGVRAIEWSTDLSKFEPLPSDTAETAQSNLRVGKYSNFTISLQNADLLYKLSFLKTYDFNIYEEFQGHRRLLGTMKNNWFLTSD